MLTDIDSDVLLHAQLAYVHSPAYQLKPKLFQDGNAWIALYGDNIQEGVCGVGKSPYEAFANFDNNWLKKIGE